MDDVPMRPPLSSPFHLQSRDDAITRVKDPEIRELLYAHSGNFTALQKELARLQTLISRTSSAISTATTPLREFNILAYGGLGDALLDNWHPFRRVMTDIRANGSGRLVVPTGIYRIRYDATDTSRTQTTGVIDLSPWLNDSGVWTPLENVEIYFENGAELWMDNLLPNGYDAQAHAVYARCRWTDSVGAPTPLVWNGYAVSYGHIKLMNVKVRWTLGSQRGVGDSFRFTGTKSASTAPYDLVMDNCSAYNAPQVGAIFMGCRQVHVGNFYAEDCWADTAHFNACFDGCTVNGVKAVDCQDDTLAVVTYFPSVHTPYLDTEEGPFSSPTQEDANNNGLEAVNITKIGGRGSALKLLGANRATVSQIYADAQGAASFDAAVSILSVKANGTTLAQSGMGNIGCQVSGVTAVGGVQVGVLIKALGFVGDEGDTFLSHQVTVRGIDAAGCIQGSFFGHDCNGYTIIGLKTDGVKSETVNFRNVRLEDVRAGGDFYIQGSTVSYAEEDLDTMPYHGIRLGAFRVDGGHLNITDTRGLIVDGALSIANSPGQSFFGQRLLDFSCPKIHIVDPNRLGGTDLNDTAFRVLKGRRWKVDSVQIDTENDVTSNYSLIEIGGGDAYGNTKDVRFSAVATTGFNDSSGRYVVQGGAYAPERVNWRLKYLNIGETAAKWRHVVRDDDWDAKGDARRLTDIAFTGTTITSAAAPFRIGDAGKTVCVLGAGVAGVPLTTEIVAFASSTEVEVAATADTPVTGAHGIFGTDNTEVLTSLIAAETERGRPVRISGGQYLVTGQIEMTELDGFALRGDGGTSIIIPVSSLTDNLFDCSGGTDGEFSDFTIDGYYLRKPSLMLSAIYGDGTVGRATYGNIRVRGLRIKNWEQQGIGIGANVGYTVEDVEITDNYFDTCGVGWLNGSFGGGPIDTGSGGTKRRYKIMRNKIRMAASATLSVDAIFCGHGKNYDFLICNNQIFDSSGHGIQLHNRPFADADTGCVFDGAILEGNLIRDAGTSAIGNLGASRCSIVGNTIIDPCSLAGGSTSAITISHAIATQDPAEVNGDVVGLHIADNIVTDTRGTPSMEYGIRVSAVGVIANGIIDGNLITNYGTDQILWENNQANFTTRLVNPGGETHNYATKHTHYAANVGTQNSEANTVGNWLLQKSAAAAGGYLVGLGLNCQFDGTNWVTGADGGSNGGALIVINYGDANIQFYCFPDVGTTPQTIAPASLLTYRVGYIETDGKLTMKNLRATDLTGTARPARISAGGDLAGGPTALTDTNEVAMGTIPDGAILINSSGKVGGLSALTADRLVKTGTGGALGVNGALTVSAPVVGATDGGLNSATWTDVYNAIKTAIQGDFPDFAALAAYTYSEGEIDTLLLSKADAAAYGLHTHTTDIHTHGGVTTGTDTSGNGGGGATSAP